MAKNEFAKMTPEQRAECGRKGGIAKREATRRRKEMRETLEILLEMPLKKGKVYTAEEIKSFAQELVKIAKRIQSKNK